MINPLANCSNLSNVIHIKHLHLNSAGTSAYGLRPEIAADLTEHERGLMGFRTWSTYGTSDDFESEWARPAPRTQACYTTSGDTTLGTDPCGSRVVGLGCSQRAKNAADVLSTSRSWHHDAGGQQGDAACANNHAVRSVQIVLLQ